MPIDRKQHFFPGDDYNETIWRYMDISKFLALVDKQALYFPSAAQLAALDPFEGLFTSANVRLEEATFESIRGATFEDGRSLTEDDLEFIQKTSRIVRPISKALRNRTFISSWHIQECESAAMWQLYMKSDEGIAIQSTTRRLYGVLDKIESHSFCIGKIRYIDYEKEMIPMNNLFEVVLHKRKSFEHERELRVMISQIETEGNKIKLPKEGEAARGLEIPINLEALIERVYISPSAQPWQQSTLKSIVNKLGFQFPVIQSILNSTPLY